MKSRGWGVCLLIGGLLLAGCGSSGGESAGTDGGETMTVGLVGTLSGEAASYAQEIKQGADLAVEQLNAKGGIGGRTVEMRVADDQGEPANGPITAQQMCDDSDVTSVIGYSISSVLLAAMPVYTSCQMPVLAQAATSPELTGVSPYFHRNVLTDAIQGSQAGQYAANVLGLDRVAILYVVNAYGQGLNDEFSKAFEAAGGSVVYSEGYQTGTTNFNAQLTAIKSTDAQAIYIGGFYPEASKIAIQAKKLGVNLQLLGSDAAFSPDLIKLGGDAVEGMVLYAVFSAEAPNSAAGAQFVKDYNSKYGVDPTSWAALGYDGILTIDAAVEAGGGASREAIQAGLAKVDFDGVTGHISIDENGDRAGKVFFLVVENGAFVAAKEQLF